MQFNKKHIILVTVVLMLSGLSLHSQIDFYVSPSAVVHISNAVVRVNGSITVDNNGTLAQQSNSLLYITNNLIVNGTFTSSSGSTTYFIGTDNSTLSGAGAITFYTLVLNKNSNTLWLHIYKNISIQNNLAINQGILNLDTYTANNTSSSGTFSIDANARLIVGGANNLSLVINNYSNYSVDTDSFIQFDGNSDQHIDLLPSNLTSGLGNVDLTNSGTKIVSNPLLIKGNLTNYAPSILQINAVNALQVNKNVINNSSINNSGILEIGQ